MNKLLMLGTSLGSIEIVETAKEMGYYTIVTDDLDPNRSPAKKVADEYWMINTNDLDLLEKRCREEKINAIFAGVSEFNLDRVKELTERLELPCYIEDAAWKYARDKSIFKKKCREFGIPIVEEYTVSDPPQLDELTSIEYPVVVKPVDGNGNRGLSICNNETELLAGCRRARENSESGSILIERYIAGEESWHFYFLADGVIRHIYSGCVFRQPGYPTFLYVLGTLAVTEYHDFKEQFDEKCAAFLKSIGCKNGIAWFQLIRDRNGKYYALEMAQRMSADSSGRVLKKSIGVNNIKWMLDLAFGKKHTAEMIPQSAKTPYKCAHYVYYHFADRDGEIASIQGYNNLDPERYQVSLVAHEGDYIPKYRLMVRIVFNVYTADEICESIRYINAKTRILDINNNNMYIQFTDFDLLNKFAERQMAAEGVLAN